MRSSYANMLVLGTTKAAVLEALGGRVALVADEVDGVVAVFHDEVGGGPAFTITGPLSAALHGPLLFFSAHGAGVLDCQAWQGGSLVAEASAPEVQKRADVATELSSVLAEFAPELALPRAQAEGPEAFVDAVGTGDRAAAVDVFRADFVLAGDRQEALLAALGLPTFAASWGRRHLLEDGDDYGGPPLTATGGR
ncbi:MAG TPA: hypothetical protein VFJ85_04325 [Acidimicrobiales bacterium]|nr:hypothetical protein [Acidimicrobiales bacterium]